MPAFPEALPAKPGYDLLKDDRLHTPLAGAIRIRGNGTTKYPVLAVLKQKNQGTYIVVLSKNSSAPGYSRNDVIEYSCTAFSNANTINAFTVVEVEGPLQFKCTGPARLNV